MAVESAPQESLVFLLPTNCPAFFHATCTHVWGAQQVAKAFPVPGAGPQGMIPFVLCGKQCVLRPLLEDVGSWTQRQFSMVGVEPDSAHHRCSVCVEGSQVPGFDRQCSVARTLNKPTRFMTRSRRVIRPACEASTSARVRDE